MSTGLPGTTPAGSRWLAGGIYIVAVTGILLPFRDEVTTRDAGAVAGGRRCGGGAHGRADRGAPRCGRRRRRVQPGCSSSRTARSRWRRSTTGSPSRCSVLVAVSAATLVGHRAGAAAGGGAARHRDRALWQSNEAMRAEQARLAAEKECAPGRRRAARRHPAVGVARPAHARWPRSGRSCRTCATARSTTDSTRQELLDLVVDEADRLDRLVQNLLSMSRIEAGSLAPERQAHPHRGAAGRTGPRPVARAARRPRLGRAGVRAAARRRRLHDGRAGGDQPPRQRGPPRAARARGSRRRRGRAARWSRWR